MTAAKTTQLPSPPAAGFSLHPLPSSSRLDCILLYGTFSLLMFAPLAFGAVEWWAIFIMEAGAALLLCLWSIRQYSSGELQLSLHPLFSPMFVFAVVIGIQIAVRLSAYHYATVSQALLYCAFGIYCFITVQALRRTRQLRTLTIVLSSYGFAIATFALIQSMSSNGKLYWLRTPRQPGWIYGPYVSHNHYAGLMEMLLPIPLVFCLTRFARGPRKTMAAVSAAIMASTIFLSGSRGGMVAFSAQMTLLAVFLIAKRTYRRTAVALILFLGIVLGLLTWIGGSELTHRLTSISTETRTELSGGTRMAINRDGLKMFARKPVLGWGLAVFPEAFPEFRTFYTNFFINRAHNDYLQLLVEMGTLGFATMLWFMVIVFRKSLGKTRNWTESPNGAVAVATLLGISGILVHGFVDSNLQIPANTALFYVFCTLAAMEPRFGNSHRTFRRHSPKPQDPVSA
jgi:O-antigen ligase